MKVIRTFVAVLSAQELRDRIAKVQEQVKKLAPDVKWVAPENFHVTLKFLGSVREEELLRVFSAVDEAVSAIPAFDISFSGLGAFPNPAKARVVWVGIENGREELRALADSVDASLARLGFAKEERGFKAHITIGRVKDGRLPSEFVNGIKEINASNLGSQRVTGVAVMQSELHKEGPAYSPLSETKLV
jgi:2'-5' RNA ligase